MEEKPSIYIYSVLIHLIQNLYHTQPFVPYRYPHAQIKFQFIIFQKLKTLPHLLFINKPLHFNQNYI